LVFPFSAGLGATLGSGRQWMPWVHIDDWIALVLHALLDHRVEGPINLAAPEPVRNAEFTHTLSRVLHRPAFLRVPAFVLNRFPQGREGALVSQRVVPAKAEALGFQFRHPHLEAALEDLLARA
jgi:NAD dependent epimerase/dehydratase family enzyme